MRVRARTNMEGFRRVRTMAEALQVGHDDLRGPVLTIFGQVHRKQTKAIFASEGAANLGRWPELSPGYKAWKRRKYPRRKILVLTGDMKDRFVSPTNPYYFQEFKPSARGGTFYFGARSDKAAAHRSGVGSLPIRDMITKTTDHLQEFRVALVVWYRARADQVLRHFGPQIAQTRPR